ncbi:hypothetical protein K439DRAFT_211963 [Ramaria rubella]|nr:hypothetical protein K439DRAFT_211963 [Ramaria rubella]
MYSVSTLCQSFSLPASTHSHPHRLCLCSTHRRLADGYIHAPQARHVGPHTPTFEDHPRTLHTRPRVANWVQVAPRRLWYRGCYNYCVYRSHGVPEGVHLWPQRPLLHRLSTTRPTVSGRASPLPPSTSPHMLL